ncbi:MAG: glycoside hydrolase family 2 TIM barrel-domain containing protein [Eubacteriales bacterium]|nr:glycoside hydrolase family 2 TIM barrel-domain containing protein [Eubacteriales bacterium]
MARTTESFNQGWKFQLGDCAGAQNAGYPDNDWRCLDVPHDWSIEGEFDKDHPSGGDGAYLPAGTGWYRKHFNKGAGPVTLLEFDGVFQNCDVWLNGEHLAHHNYGYMGFELDITAHLRDGDNVLAVRVDNAAQPNSRWYTGSGIYRNVWLTQAQETRVAHWGVFVSTPHVSPESADVKVQAELTGRAELALTILDKDGTELCRQAYPAAQKHIHTLRVDNPALWGVDSPILYTLRTQVLLDGAVVDEVDTPFGIRSIRFDADDGFFINDVHTKLNGVCIHHDAGSLGAAVPLAVWERRLKVLKEMGCNAIRMSHNPPAPELLDLCDRLGFLVMDEAFDEWLIIKRKSEHDAVTYGYGPYFDEDSDGDIAAMVRRDRNHASIVIWSIGNEIPEQATPHGHLMARRLQAICHIEDPTRLCTMACDNIKADSNSTTDAFLRELDVIGVNYVNRWGIHTETGYAWERHHYPDKILLGTEHSSIGGVRGEYSLKSSGNRWWAAPYYSRMIRAEHLLKQTMAHDFICGDFMWTGIDYLGESRWPNKNSASGVIDMCAFPKDGYYLYQSQWTKTPMLHLFPHWNWQGHEGEVLPVICYTNCATVELFVNGRSMGVKAYEFPMQGMSGQYGNFAQPHIAMTTSDLHVSWDVPYEPGVVKAVGRDRYGNVLLEQQIKTVGAPAALVLEPDKTRYRGNGDIVHCTIKVVDENGDVCPLADNEVTVTVDGAARLIGLDNGHPGDLTPMKTPTRKVSAGLALAIVQTTGGDAFTVSLSSPGLAGASVQCHIQ